MKFELESTANMIHYLCFIWQDASPCPAIPTYTFLIHKVYSKPFIALSLNCKLSLLSHHSIWLPCCSEHFFSPHGSHLLSLLISFSIHLYLLAYSSLASDLPFCFVPVKTVLFFGCVLIFMSKAYFPAEISQPSLASALQRQTAEI